LRDEHVAARGLASVEPHVRRRAILEMVSLRQRDGGEERAGEDRAADRSSFR
jgi:hypothetical protein